MDTGVLHNYLVTAMRVLARNRMYSAINIIGLGSGLACCILILLFVRDELSYDRWLPDAERIARLGSTFIIPGRDMMRAAQAPGPAREAMQKHFGDDIETAVRVIERRPAVNLGDRQFNDLMIEADPEFFDVFALPFVAGDPKTALADNSSVVLSESIARKYFGDEAALGRTFTITRDKPETYKVTGVIRDIPSNSHLDISLLRRLEPSDYLDEPWVLQEWTSVNVYSYFKFRDTAALERVSGRLEEFVDKNVNFDIAAVKDIRPGDLFKLDLMPVPRIHLHTVAEGGFKPGGNIMTVYTFSAVAVLILLIASINFMNLATARSMQRAREVSMRKVVGATRGHLIAQFIGESVLMTLPALLLAVLAVTLALPWYNAYIGKQLAFNVFTDPMLAAVLVGLAVLVGVIGGLYPAFFLSRFRPAAILKANQSGQDGSAWLRNLLVVVQFSISIALIATTAVVYWQTWYARNIDAGYNKEQMVVIRGVGRDEVAPLQMRILQELEKVPGVVSVSRTSDSIPQDSNNNTLVQLPDRATQDLLVIETLKNDYNFFPLLGVKPLAGRLFSAEYAGDVMPPDADKLETPVTPGIVLNERAVHRLGFASAEAAVGQTVGVSIDNDRYAPATVVGVIADLHFRSVHHEISPMIYYVGDSEKDFSYLILRIAPGDVRATLEAIDRVWAGIVPDMPIKRSFVDEDFAELYTAEQERMKMFAGFSVFAVFVACLGLFGLASFTADRRTREIGIRKVLGASVGDIVRLLLWQFSRPVLIANLIAWPLAWYFMNGWLQEFEYRIEPGAWPFLGAGLLALVIAWATVIVHAYRVSQSNPVKALRYE